LVRDFLALIRFSLTKPSEIQELRHKSQFSGDAAATTVVIDKALMNLDERLEAVADGMKSVSESVAPLQNHNDTPHSEQAALVRKHAVLVTEWETVQNETDVLREELKEDKWLTVFRTVTEQADGMMGSLEKAVNRCQVRSCLFSCFTLIGPRILYGKYTGEAQTIHSRNHHTGPRLAPTRTH
jgi:hypothetical protein